MSSEQNAELMRRVSERMQTPLVRFQPALGGYTSALRGIAAFADGRTAFVKAATSEQTAGWLRTEYVVYCHLNSCGADFLPAVQAWDDDGSLPVLLLEDLSDAHWPPPWTPEQIGQVSETLSRLRAMPLMPGMSLLETYREDFSGWRKLAEDPAAFLALGLCTPAWLAAALPSLQAAEAAAVLAGSDFLHLDLRSDNICFARGRAILVDWNWACAGNGQFDLASWLPSLCAEGGPLPETWLPDASEMAAALSGFWAAQAGSHALGSRLQSLNLRQLQSALPWACRALGLPPCNLSVTAVS